MIVKDDSYLVKARVELGEFFGSDSAEAFVVLREPTTKDLIAIKDAVREGETKTLETFADVLPRVIVEHNLATPERDMSPAEVAALICNKIAIYSKVMSEYTAAVFPQAPTSGDKSDGSPGPSSEAKE